MSFRLQKINHILQKEISEIILKEIDLENTFVTITNVETASNILESNILITVFPEEKEEKILRILNRNIYDIQKLLDKKLKMKPVPKIYFKIDEGMKNLYKIDKLENKKS